MQNGSTRTAHCSGTILQEVLGGVVTSTNLTRRGKLVPGPSFTSKSSDESPAWTQPDILAEQTKSPWDPFADERGGVEQTRVSVKYGAENKMCIMHDVIVRGIVHVAARECRVATVDESQMQSAVACASYEVVLNGNIHVNSAKLRTCQSSHQLNLRTTEHLQ